VLAPAPKLFKTYVGKAATDMTPLLPGTPHAKAPQEKDWRLYVNAEVEAET